MTFDDFEISESDWATALLSVEDALLLELQAQGPRKIHLIVSTKIKIGVSASFTFSPAFLLRISNILRVCVSVFYIDDELAAEAELEYEARQQHEEDDLSSALEALAVDESALSRGRL